MDQSATVKVSSRHQISIPSQARQQLGIQSGDYLLVDVQDGMLILLPKPKSYTNYLAGLYQEIWEDVDTTAYLEQERDAWTQHSNPE